MPKHRLGAALALALLFCATADAHAFGFAPEIRVPSHGEAESVAIGDVSGDGRDDLVVATNAYFANAWSNHALIHVQQADGRLAQPVAVPYTTTYGSPRGLALADLDADGVLDIAVGHAGGLALLRRDGTGGFSLRTVATNRSGNVLARLDVDRNGVDDIVALSNGGPATIHYGDGFGGIASQQTLGTQSGGFNDLKIGDLDGNGFDDLAIMSSYSYSVPNLTVYRSDGMAGWLASQNYFVGTNELTAGLAVGDFDDDGRDDAILSRGRNSPTWLWRYRQDANGQLQATATLPSYDIPSTLQAVDLDRDGRDDVAVLHSGWSRLGLYLQGSAGLGAEQLVTIPYQSHYTPQGLAFGDLDGDGCTDAAIALNGDGVSVLAGRGCAPTADLAVAIRAEARKTVAVDVSHLGGTAAGKADVAIEFRARVFGRIVAPANCVAQPSVGRVQAYRCTTETLRAGASETLRFALGISSVTVSADVASDAPDPDESNNAAIANLRF